MSRLALSTKALAALVRPGHRKPTPSIDPDEVSAGAGHRHASAMALEQDPSPRRRYIDGEGRDGRGSTRLPPAVDGGAAERRGRAAFVFRGTGPPSSMSGSCAATRASRAPRARHDKRGDWTEAGARWCTTKARCASWSTKRGAKGLRGGRDDPHQHLARGAAGTPSSARDRRDTPTTAGCRARATNANKRSCAVNA